MNSEPISSKSDKSERSEIDEVNEDVEETWNVGKNLGLYSMADGVAIQACWRRKWRRSKHQNQRAEIVAGKLC